VHEYRLKNRFVSSPCQYYYCKSSFSNIFKLYFSHNKISFSHFSVFRAIFSHDIRFRIVDSKAISLKSKFRGRNPLYRLKPEFGKKVLEIQRNQPGPTKKKGPSIFRIPTSETLPFFQSPKKAQKV
jgi:hypothetical protein